MIFETGLGVKLTLTGGGLAGIALITSTTGGAQQTGIAARPQAVTAICGYATTQPGGTGRPASRTNAALASDNRTSAHALTKLGLNDRQQTSALIIVSTAAAQGMPERAAIIGVATSLQESDLGIDLTGDHGTSVGLFHQKPTSGYGTRRQILDPHHAALGFFARLRRVKEWERLPLTVAAQTVQHSRFPDAYARHQRRAEQIVHAIGFGRPPTRPPGTPRPHPASRADGLATTTREQIVITSGVLQAAAEGLPREKAVSAITTALTTELDRPDNAFNSHGHDADPLSDTEDVRDRVAALVQQVAAQLCTQLTRRNRALPRTIPSSSRGRIAVQAATKMIGIPYSWGGGGPAGPSKGIDHGSQTTGFDCSGLTEYAWARAGARIGSTTGVQWRTGTKIHRNRLQPGDLLFFAHNTRDPATIHHVGINLDGTRMIHAPQTGRTVEITHWKGVGYREREFIGAVRP